MSCVPTLVGLEIGFELYARTLHYHPIVDHLFLYFFFLLVKWALLCSTQCRSTVYSISLDYSSLYCKLPSEQSHSVRALLNSVTRLNYSWNSFYGVLWFA